MTAKKKVRRDFQWVGVRFMYGEGAEAKQIYTYKVKKGVKLFLGQELVVHNIRGSSVVVVVQIGKEPQSLTNGRSVEDMNWKWITSKVADL